MRALLLALLGLTAACGVSLEAPRAFRCSADTECSGGWKCARDGYCHDPAVGRALPCERGEDCTGGWYCGKDLVCRDPATPADLPCDDDSQCATAWRCSTEGRCADAAGLTLTGPATEGVARVSPHFPQADAVAGVASVLESDALGNVTHLQLSSALLLDAGVLQVVVEWVGPPEDRKAAPHYRFTPTMGPLEHVATSGGDLLLQVAQGGAHAVVWPAPDGGMELVAASAEPVEVRSFTARPVDGGVSPRFVVRVGDAVGLFEPALGPFTAEWPLPGGHALVDFEVVPGTTGPRAWALARDPNDAGVLFELSAGTPAIAVEPWGDSHPPRTAPFMPAEELLALRMHGDVAMVGASDVEGGGLVRAWVTAGKKSPVAVACPEGSHLLDFAAGLDGTGNPAWLDALCAADDDDSHGVFRLVLPDDFRLLYPVERSVLSPVTAGGQRARFDGQPWWTQALGYEEGGPALPPRVSFGPDGPLDFLGLAHVRATGLDFLLAAGQSALGWSLALGSDFGLTWDSATGEEGGQVQALLEPVRDAIVSRGGVVVRTRYTLDGGPPEAWFSFPSEEPSSARVGGALEVDLAGGTVRVLALGDALWTGAYDEDFHFTTHEPRLRPAPGFDITSLSVRPTATGGAEGWLVANSRLFKLTGRSLERWSATELALRERDPMAVWHQGAQALVALTSGEVVAVPQRIPVVPPAFFADASELVPVCGTVAALFEGSSFLLSGEGDGGLAWTLVDPVVVEEGRLWSSAGRLFRSDGRGVVDEVALSGCTAD